MRARNIKPGFFKNEALGECSVGARLLFIGLWLLADRKGRLEFRPRRWKAEVFPYDNADPEALCEELTRQGLVLLYEVEGVQHVWIPRFLAHQKPHPREKASVIPAHPDDKGVPPDYQEDDPEPPQVQPKHNLGTTKVQPRQCSARLNPERGILNPERGILKEEACPEPSPASGPSPAVFSFPVIGRTKTEPIYQHELDEWKTLFPALDVPQVVRECLAWNLANPTRRKTPAGVRRHIVQWLTREQNSGRHQGKPLAGLSEEEKLRREVAEVEAILAKGAMQ